MKLYYRIYQRIFQVGSYFIKWRMPEVLEGENSLLKLPNAIKKYNVSRILIVTDKGILSLGLIDNLLKELNSNGIVAFIYDGTIPNPTIENIEEAVNIYKDNQCEGIIAFGGGSPMDCAKGVGARIALPKKPISKMKGMLKINKTIPPLFAVPTTAGTGSEATITAVITDSNNHDKYPINDGVLTPNVAVLDPCITIGLPPNLTSTTGMDALTHAIEAYIGRSNTNNTKEQSRKATKLIYANIEKAFLEGQNMDARKNMQMASFYAGQAFTRAYVGYVHAIAHALGALYSTPHGFANAIILPYVLEYYGKSIYKPLSELADLVEISNDNDTIPMKANKFIESIRMLNKNMNIPSTIKEIRKKDIPLIAEKASKEANPTYPVPKILNEMELQYIISSISDQSKPYDKDNLTKEER